MNRHSQEFLQLVERLKSGELTRKQACDEYSIHPGTLSSWLLRSNLNEVTRLKTKDLYGEAAKKVLTDPVVVGELEEATKKVLSGEIPSCLAASRVYKNIKLGTLTVRVRKARLAAGQEVVRRSKR